MIYGNVPTGSVIATEHWDYGLPVLKPEWNRIGSPACSWSSITPTIPTS